MAVGKSKYSERLAGMKDGFKNSQKQSKIMDGDETFPVGIFEGKVTAKLKEAKSSGNLMVSRMFVVVSGEMAGLPCFDNLVIEHENPMVESRNQRTLMRFLGICGYEFDSTQPEQLEAILEELSKEAPLVKFETKHSESADGRVFVNVDVLGLAGSAAASDTKTSRAGAASSPAIGKHKSATPPPAEEPVDDGSTLLRAFVTSHNLDVGKQDVDDMTADELAAVINEYEFKEDELTDEEKEMLVGFGLESCIVKPVTEKRKSRK